MTRLFAWVVLLMVLLSGASATAPANLNLSVTPAPRQQTASYYPVEVRLRKLHLVRPDLIPYPLDVEVVC